MKQITQLEAMLHRHGLLAASVGREIAISGLSNDSRQVVPGDLFICKGYGFKPEYLEMARQSGAVCYLAEEKIESSPLPAILVSDVRKAQSLAAMWFYDHPADSFQLVGITGTKGKTTTVYMTRAVMDAVAGCETGLLSGKERYVGGEVVNSHLTTPESLELQQLLAQAREHHMPIVTLEVSSQAYQVHRVYGQHFNYGAFLNIGPDHISPHEHPTMEDYLHCKEALLENSDVAVVVRSTDYFDDVLRAAGKAKRTLVVGLEQDGCDYSASEVVKLPRGYRFTVTEKATGRRDVYSIAMDGLFNIENALVAIAIGRDMGGDPAKIARALATVVVPGRADVYQGGGLTVFINYMHNGLSCEAVLKALNRDYPGKFVTVVIGIAGQRSAQRLTGVGQACGQYADRVFFSADDPDLEDPRDIDERLAHAAAGGKAEVIIEPDRTRAVERALLEAPEGSIVVLAGKGDEDTQRVNGVYVPYESDPAIMRRVLPLREKR